MTDGIVWAVLTVLSNMFNANLVVIRKRHNRNSCGEYKSLLCAFARPEYKRRKKASGNLYYV